MELSKNTVLATNFLYPNYTSVYGPRDLSDTEGIRGDLSSLAIRNILGLGIPIVAADGGSSGPFLDALGEFKHKGLTVVTGMEKGRAPQRRAAFEKALMTPGVRAVLYYQGEKNLSPFISQIVAPILEGRADIVIPARTPGVLPTWPEYQIKSERKVNTWIDRLMRLYGLMSAGQHFDWFFGPVAFSARPEVSRLFLDQYEIDDSTKSMLGKPNPEIFSGDHYPPSIDALFSGMSVASVEIPYSYPEFQKLNEMNPDTIDTLVHRRITDGHVYRVEMLHFMWLLKGDPRSKMRLVTK